MRKFISLAIAVLLVLPAVASITNEELIKIQQTKKYTELWGQRATLFNTLGCDSTNIVMLGNSLTHGCEWHELLGDDRVINRGINGDIVEGITDRLDCVVEGHPAKIFLLTGANDVSHNLTADSIARATGELVHKIRERSPQTKVYVQSMLPINYKTYQRYKAMKDKEQVIRDVNKFLKPIVEAEGAVWINLYDSFADEEGNLHADWTNDGLHITAPGYLKWREIILPYIKE